LSSKWFAVYTRPRWEKKVHSLLDQKGIENYCPLNKVRKKWSDRVKIIEEPLFKSYVFVKVNDADRTRVRVTDGVINFVYWNGKPAIIKEKEILTIRRFLSEHENVEIQSLNFKPEQKVIVTSGSMMDKEGNVLEVKNKIVKVAIESMGYTLIAHIDRTKLTLAP